MRGQTTLPIIGIALVLVTSVGVLAVFAGQGSIQQAKEPALERATAIGLSERLIESRSDLAVRENVIAANETDELDEGYVRDTLGVGGGADVSITLDGQTLVDTGVRGEATTFERIVWIERYRPRVREPRIRGGVDVTLPRRVTRVNLTLDPRPDTTVRAVTADDQVVLANESGLTGTYEVDISRFETTEMSVDAVGQVRRGDLELAYRVPRRKRAILAVVVDV